MKTVTRVTRPSPRPPSPSNWRGTSTLVIRLTRPSAGDTIKFSPIGVTRTGSRKKAATQIAMPSSTKLSAVHSSTSPLNRTAASAIPRNLRPSGCMSGRRYLALSPGTSGSGPAGTSGGGAKVCCCCADGSCGSASGVTFNAFSSASSSSSVSLMLGSVMPAALAPSYAAWQLIAHCAPPVDASQGGDDPIPAAVLWFPPRP